MRSAATPFLRFDLPSSTVDEVSRHLAFGSEPEKAMLAVAGSAEVTVLPEPTPARRPPSLSQIARGSTR